MPTERQTAVRQRAQAMAARRRERIGVYVRRMRDGYKVEVRPVRQRWRLTGFTEVLVVGVARDRGVSAVFAQDARPRPAPWEGRGHQD